MLEAILGAENADLIVDLYQILFTDWSKSELKVLAIFTALVITPTVRQIVYGEPKGRI